MSATLHQAATATRAYRTAQRHRSLREQEADIFRRMVDVLRAARDQPPLHRVRAICDNRLLWNTVLDLARASDNALPEGLRGGLVSIALAVQQEMRSDDPDFDVLISINENIAAGLSGPS